MGKQMTIPEICYKYLCGVSQQKLSEQTSLSKSEIKQILINSGLDPKSGNDGWGSGADFDMAKKLAREGIQFTKNDVSNYIDLFKQKKFFDFRTYILDKYSVQKQTTAQNYNQQSYKQATAQNYDQQNFKQAPMQNYNQQNLENSFEQRNVNKIQQLPKSHVNTTADTTGDASKKSKVIIGGICTVALIIVAIFLFRSVIGGGNPLNSKNALNEIQHFIPTQLSGMTIGEMFDGACANGVWSSYEVDDHNGLFSAAATWVRFSGNSERGAINATFTITKKRMLDYTCFVDGKPIVLEELYRMFHDPNYDKDLRAAAEAAKNEAKFDAAEEKINKMSLMHNYVVDDFKGMTILKFTDSVCTSGEWSSNDKTGNLRVVFEGKSEKGKVQAIFDVDEKLRTVKGSWYFNSHEISATDLYQKFYP